MKIARLIDLELEKAPAQEPVFPTVLVSCLQMVTGFVQPRPLNLPQQLN